MIPPLGLEDLIEMQHPLLFMCENDKRDMLKALSMSYWSYTDELKSNPTSDGRLHGDYAIVANRIPQCKTDFVRTLKKMQVDTSIETVENLMDVEALEKIQPASTPTCEAKKSMNVSLDLMKRFAEIQISPILDVWLLQKERDIVRRLSKHLISQDWSMPINRDIATECNGFLEVAISSPGWNPEDLRPFQTIAWAFESALQQDDMTRLLKCLIPTMHLKVSDRLWRNTFHSTNIISSRLDLPVQWSSPGEDSYTEGVDRVTTAFAANCSLVRTRTIFDLIGEEMAGPYFGTGHFLTLENHQARHHQAKAIVSQLADYPSMAACIEFPHDVLYLFFNVVEAIQDHFSSNVLDMLQSVLTRTTRPSYDDMSSLAEVMEGCRYARFKACFEEIVRPLLRSIPSCWDVDEESLDVAKLWIYVGLLRVNLLVPQSPLDPGKKPIMKVERLDSRLQLLRAVLNAYRLDKGMLTGCFAPLDSLTEIWSSEVKEIARKRSKQQKKMVKRSEQSPLYADLFAELRAFWKTALLPSNVFDIVGNLGSADRKLSRRAIDKEMNWQVTSGAFIDRLTSYYSSYDDVVLPIAGAVQCVQQGLRQIRDQTSTNALQHCKDESVLSWLLDYPFSVSSDRMEKFANIKSMMQQGKEKDVKAQKQYALAISLSMLSRVGLERRAKGVLDSETKVKCMDIFGFLASSWADHKDGSEESKSLSDEEEQERLYREQFPNHRQDFAELLEDQAEAVDSDKRDATKALTEISSESIGDILTDEHISAVFDLYKEIVLPDLEVNMDAARLRSFQISYRAAHLMMKIIDFKSKASKSNPENAASHCLAVSLCCHLSPTTNASTDTPSFHADPNPLEVQKAAPLLESLLARTSQLLTAFPGHEILVALGRVVEYVWKLQLACTSVGKALTGLEIVLRKAQEWEQHASQRVTLGQCLTDIGHLVASWRKLEIASWNALLSAREHRFVLRARRHWMRLYRVLNDPHEEEGSPGFFKKRVVVPRWVWKGLPKRSKDVQFDFNELNEMAKILDTFILTASLGEFQERLELLKSMAFQFCDLSTERTMAKHRLLDSLYGHYSQYLPYIMSEKQRMKKPLQEKLQNEAKLAKWDEQSYYALVESSERNHRKLMQILREYDDILQTPVTLLFEQDNNKGIRATNASASEATTSVPLTATLFPRIQPDHDCVPIRHIPLAGQRNWSSTSVAKTAGGHRFLDGIHKLHGKLSSVVKDEVAASGTFYKVGLETSNSFCDAIFQRLESLRSDNATKQMKQRAFTDLMKALKANGFRTTKWSVPTEIRQMTHILQLPVPDLSSSFDAPETNTELESAKLYFERTITEVQRLRSEVSMLGSQYMTTREMELMRNVGDHGLFFLAQQRSLLAIAISEVNNLKARLSVQNSLAVELPLNQSWLVGAIHEFEAALDYSKEHISQLRLLASKMVPLVSSCITFRDLTSILDASRSKLDGYRRVANIDCIAARDVEDVQKSAHSLAEVLASMEKAKELCCSTSRCLPPDGFDICIRSVKIALVAANAVVDNKPQASTAQTPSINAFFEFSSQTIEKTLLAVQKVNAARESFAKVDENLTDVTLWDAHVKASHEWDSLNLVGIEESLQAAISGIRNIHETSSVPKDRRDWLLSVAADTCVMVDQVLHLALRRLGDAITFFRSSAKLQYVLLRVFRTLVAKGYCADSTSEEGGDGDGTGNVSGMKFEDDVEGTGMGEGDGKEDVTDQLESEEQLAGLKGDAEGENAAEKSDDKQLNEEEAKQGMEMEADFDGDMFDVPDDADDQENDNDDDEEELDREMGDGPDDMDDVVDEKMWGDSDDEEDINQGEEKFEKDSNVKGEALEDEMRTKEDGDDSKKREDAEAGEPEPENDKKQPEDNDKEEPEMDINNDFEDNYEEKHTGVDVRDEKEGQEEEEDANNDDNDMDLGDDLNFGEEQDNVDDPDDDASNSQSVDETGAPELHDAEEEDDADNNSQGSNIDEDDVEQTGGVHDGVTGQPEEEEDKEEEDDEIDGPRVNQSTTANTPEAAFGVEAKDGVDNVKDQRTDADDVEEGGQGEEENEGQGQDESPQQEQGSGGNQGSGGQREEGSGADNEGGAQSEAPNPFKDPGDATKFWHRKLRMMEREQAEEVIEQPNEESGDVDGTDDAKESGEFEYAADKEAATTQVLGETSEEVVSQFEQKEPDPNDMEEETTEDPVDTKTSNPQENTSRSRKANTPSQSQPMGNDENVEETEPTDEEEMDEEDQLSHADKNEEEEELDDDDEEVLEGQGNQVVSDMAQLQMEENPDMTTILAPDEIVEEEQTTGISSEEISASKATWFRISSETHNLSRRLCEKLRLVMEPLLATKLKGDYRTGKRINMKKVIGYVASGYRKDKIWLRRTKPAKRNYRVLLAVDNSESMSKSGAGDMALAAMATLAVGMSQLEIGELGIASFGDDMRLLHPFHLPFTSESGPAIVHNFPFDEKRTRTSLCVESVLKAMETPGDHASMQLVFLISDGRIERDSRALLRRLVREMAERNILLVMLIVEGNHEGGKKKKDSIVHMKEVTFEKGKPVVRQFIENYPFPYYIILEDMQSLPEVLGDALRQWFEMIAQLHQK